MKIPEVKFFLKSTTPNEALAILASTHANGLNSSINVTHA